jgi:DNA (cytosine-5)-methyltransferase 1
MLVSRGLAVVISDLAEMGYDAQWCVVSASDCGAPHKRDRIWILAHANLSQRQRGRISCGIRSQHADTSSGSSDGDASKILAHAAQLHSNGSNDHAGISMGRKQIPEFGNSGWEKCVANASSIGQPRQKQSWFSGDPAEKREGETDHAFAERCRNIWGVEPGMDRVAHGVAGRVDRLRAIGNGQVPIVAATAWRVLSEN